MDPLIICVVGLDLRSHVDDIASIPDNSRIQNRRHGTRSEYTSFAESWLLVLCGAVSEQQGTTSGQGMTEGR